jgi:hypothetical protein
MRDLVLEDRVGRQPDVGGMPVLLEPFWEKGFRITGQLPRRSTIKIGLGFV